METPDEKKWWEAGIISTISKGIICSTRRLVGITITLQTDNGSENLGEFDDALKADQIPHFFSYPHCPKIQTYIERYNRTIQEEFIDNNLDILDDKALLNRKLADYLIWYNTIRPHKSLSLRSPLQYLIEKEGMSQMSLTSTLTLL